MKTSHSLVLSLLLFATAGGQDNASGQPRSFGSDVEFLRNHTDVLVLTAPDGSGQIAAVPSMQGRIMTSTLDGGSGLSLGWINYELIASGDTLLHINPYGGEDRFWLGPEGGQYAIFFKPGDPFDLEHWFTPAPIDTEPFELVSNSESEAVFVKSASFLNHSGTEFLVDVQRKIRVIDRAKAAEYLGVPIGDSLKMVSFESDNLIRNGGDRPWMPESGLLSIWILGMFNPSPSTTVAIPFEKGPEETRGPIVNDAYFGDVPADRLIVGDGVLYFSGDGQYRSKIGLTPARAKPVMGSFDAANDVLTIVQYTKPAGETRYVNSMWEMQDEPYAGDVINSYNDGPPEPGAKPLGPFYELETSSPAAALAPGEALIHVHRTFHFRGDRNELDGLARTILGASIDEISAAGR